MRNTSPIRKINTTASALSEEDRRLFRETVGIVNPVASDRVPLAFKKAKPLRRTIESDWSELSPTHLPLLAMGDTMHFVAPGIQKKVLQRLRSGKFGLDVELDLHGLTVDEARRRLAGFLAVCLADGCRCLHLIHGKGYRSEGDYPILKNRINLWLRQHPDVLAFCTARPVDGGTGAIYILLREKDQHRA